MLVTPTFTSNENGSVTISNDDIGLAHEKISFIGDAHDGEGTLTELCTKLVVVLDAF